jgi:hypothetical protein
MAAPKLRERSLAELSRIEIRYFLGPSTWKPNLEIFVTKYVGDYPFGSAGNDDAQFMYAMAKAGVAAFESWGVIHDLSELTYEWGDRLDLVFAVGPKHGLPEALKGVFGTSVEERTSPVAVVVGPPLRGGCPHPAAGGTKPGAVGEDRQRVPELGGGLGLSRCPDQVGGRGQYFPIRGLPGVNNRNATAFPRQLDAAGAAGGPGGFAA